MLSAEKIKAMRKLKEEFKDLNEHPISNIGVCVGLPNQDNIFEWQCTLTGPKDSSYRGGLFYLGIIFPDNYPTSAPEVFFKTPIYHLNINPRNTMTERLGHVCISTLNWWKPSNTIREILTSIFALFYMANPESPYGIDKADEFRTNRPLYEEKAKFFTRKYANPSNNNINITNDWDFSY